MQVAPAHAGRLHLDDHVMGFGGRIGERHQLQFAFAGKHNAAHGFLRLFLSWPDLGQKNGIGKALNQPRAGATNKKVPPP